MVGGCYQAYRKFKKDFPSGAPPEPAIAIAGEDDVW